MRIRTADYRGDRFFWDAFARCEALSSEIVFVVIAFLASTHSL